MRASHRTMSKRSRHSLWDSFFEAAMLSISSVEVHSSRPKSSSGGSRFVCSGLRRMRSGSNSLYRLRLSRTSSRVCSSRSFSPATTMTRDPFGMGSRRSSRSKDPTSSSNLRCRDLFVRMDSPNFSSSSVDRWKRRSHNASATTALRTPSRLVHDNSSLGFRRTPFTLAGSCTRWFGLRRCPIITDWKTLNSPFRSGARLLAWSNFACQFAM